MQTISLFEGLKRKAIESYKKILLVLSIAYYGNAAVYCGDAFELAQTATETLTGKLVEIATRIFPLAIVITVIAIIMTRDERKLSMEIKVLLGICVGYILLLMVKNNVFTSTLQTLTGLSG